MTPFKPAVTYIMPAELAEAHWEDMKRKMEAMITEKENTEDGRIIDGDEEAGGGALAKRQQRESNNGILLGEDARRNTHDLKKVWPVSVGREKKEDAGSEVELKTDAGGVEG